MRNASVRASASSMVSGRAPPVTFTFVHVGFVGRALLVEPVHHQRRLRRRNDTVVGTLEEQHRCTDLTGAGHGRPAHVVVGRIRQRSDEPVGVPGFEAVRRSRQLEERGHTVRAHHRPDGVVRVRADQQCEHAAGAPAGHRGPGHVCPSLLAGGTNPSHDVFDVERAPARREGAFVAAPVPRRAAWVGREHRPSAGEEEPHLRRPTGHRGAGRTTVTVDEQRCRAPTDVPQQAVHGAAVGTLPGHGLGLGKLLRVEGAGRAPRERASSGTPVAEHGHLRSRSRSRTHARDPALAPIQRVVPPP